MNPLRRAWLSWCGNWLVSGMVAAHLLLVTGMFILALTVPEGTRSDPDHPLMLVRISFACMWLPMVLGLHLRVMIGSETMALSQAHAAWQLRLFFCVLLPLTACTIAIPLLLLGRSPLEACVAAASPTAFGAWIGFNLTSLAAGLSTLAFLLSLLAIEACSEQGRAIALVAYAVVLACGCLVAWRRTLHRPWPGLPFPGPLAVRLQSWIDGLTACGGSARMPVIARLPTLADSMRINLAIARHGWSSRLAICLAMGVCTFSTAMDSKSPEAERFGFLILLSAGMAAVGAFGAVAPGAHASRQGFSRPLMSCQLAAERLRPFSRRHGAAASLLAILTGSLVNGAMPTLAGIVLGMLASAIPLGVLPVAPWLWLVIPFALASSLVLSALLALTLTMTTWTGLVIIGVAAAILVYGPFLALIATGPRCMLPMVAALILLGALLAPLAWHRLAEAEPQ